MALPIQYVTPEQYLEIDAGNDFKSEYIDGTMIAMAGGSFNHNVIANNLAGLIHQALRGKPCGSAGSDQKIWTPGENYLFSDLVVYCGKAEVVRDVLVNPVAVFEVLSPSTEWLDRGSKLLAYRKIASLVHHVLVAQDAPRIEVLTKQGEHGPWSRFEAVGLDDSISMPAIDLKLALRDVYERVEFGTAG
jgi:Uma2 family endonuclease